MVKNYYNVLGIPTTAGLDEVHVGFKRAILKWHPRRTRLPVGQAAKEFREACEAYEVLSTSSLRSVYDAYGYNSLKSGIQSEDGSSFPAYEFKSTPEDIYKKYMQEANPFITAISNLDSQCLGSISGYSGSGKNWEIDLTPSDLHFTLPCTLEELFFGCSKSLKYSRSLYTSDSKDPVPEVATKEILIKPGYFDGQKIVYKAQGSQKRNREYGDLIITVAEKKHDKFVRKGNDLEVVVTLGLHEALYPTAIEIENLDRVVKVISVDHCISPQQELELEGQGMPVIDGNGQRGKLCVKFQIIFPEKIPEDQIENLKALLPNS